MKKRKILSWLKERTLYKVVILLSFLAFVTNVAVGCYLIGVMFLILSLSWVLVEMYAREDRTLREALDVSNGARFTQTMLSEYYQLLYVKEKITSDFCKHKMDGNEYIHRLQNITKGVERMEKLLANENAPTS